MYVQEFTVESLARKFGKPRFNRPAWIKPLFSVEDFQDFCRQIADRNAQEFLELLQENIETNKFGYSLKPDTIRQKGDDHPWIHTRELLEAIVREEDTVGLISGTHSGTSLSYSHLAMILEYGYIERGIPPRDVFRRTFRQFHKKAKQNFINACRAAEGRGRNSVL